MQEKKKKMPVEAPREEKSFCSRFTNCSSDPVSIADAAFTSCQLSGKKGGETLISSAFGLYSNGLLLCSPSVNQLYQQDQKDPSFTRKAL